MHRPNVVLMISHDTGRFLSPYGYTTVHTPHYEALASQGVAFERCFGATPLCSPARAALTTGRWPHQNGMNGLPGDTLGGWDLVEKDRHLAHVLGRSGYRSVLCGFEHETVDFFSVGFEEGIHGCGSTNNGGSTIEGSGAAIEAWFARNPGAGVRQPFYMQIGSHETHREWEMTAKPYTEHGVWKAPYLRDLPEIDREMALMQGASNKLDQGLGEIMAAFTRLGLAENTLFVVTTDHGIDFPRAKGTLFDPGVETALFMRCDRANWARGGRRHALASHVDVYRTILETCGVPVPEGTVGVSLASALANPASAPAGRDAVFLEKTYHDNYDPMRAIRTENFKYILNFDAQTLYDVRIATAPRYNWFRFPFNKGDREELYDLRRDPDEAHNAVRDPAYREIRQSLRKRLADWMRDTGDPLLDGPMPSPYHLRAVREMRALADGGVSMRHL